MSIQGIIATFEVVCVAGEGVWGSGVPGIPLFSFDFPLLLVSLIEL